MTEAPKVVVVLTVAVLGGLPSAAASSAAPVEYPPYFVGEVVVSDVTPKESLRESSVQEIDAEEIRALGATTVAEAVAHLPGVSMSVGSRNEQRVWLGGYEPANVLVLLDGVPIADPYSGEVDLGQLPVADVAKIVVATGASTSLYGPDGLGGVINIVTVQGAGEGSMGAELKLADESTASVHVSAGGSRGDVDWYLGLGRDRSDGWQLAADFNATEYQPEGRRVNSDFARWSLLGRVGRRFENGGRLTATLRFLDAEKGIPFHTERPRGFVRFARFPEWRQGTFALGWDGVIGAAGSLRAQLYGHNFDNTLDVFADKDLDERTLQSTFEDRVLGAYAVVDSEWGNHAVSAALHYREDRHHRLESTMLAARHSTERYAARNASLVVQDMVALGRGASLSMGGSVDHHAVDEAWQAVDGAPDPSSDTRFSPHAELRAFLGSRFGGSLAVYRRTRFPTLLQLYGSEVPNPGLEPQQSTGVNATVSWQPSIRTELRVRTYFDRVEKLISRLGRGYPYENQDEAELSGLELSANGRFDRIDVRVAGCVQRAIFTASSSGLDELPYVPDATLEAGVGFELGAGFGARVDWSWVGRRVWYDGTDRQVLDPYHLVRVAAGYAFPAAELRLEADNLLDDDIEQEWGYPLAGRRLWLALSTRF